ncbi:MAG: hypothetical protein R1F54_02455 [Candidatus Zeuxoniibacter abyssi]|nr:MAG: hypothetical protein R1F54_02455 [Candidatus Persebacteraceae bacterium AB1(2)]
MKVIVYKYVKQNPGNRNCDIANGLEIVSRDNQGGNRDWFSWKILNILVEENRIVIKDERKYYLSDLVLRD